MKTKAFAVYDSKVKAHMSPFFTTAAGHAIRSFEQAANDPQSALSRHPADFTLFEVGEFDEETGTFTNLKTPNSLGTALSFKNQPQTQAPLFPKMDISPPNLHSELQS